MTARPFGGYVTRKIEEIDAAYAEYLTHGFITADFEGQPEPERLQCRNELDRTNWLGLVVDCQAKIGFGLGDVVQAGTLIRCTSNRMYQISPNDALSRMFGLLGQAKAAQENWWRLKDLARSAEKRTDLDLIDLTGGWP